MLIGIAMHYNIFEHFRTNVLAPDERRIPAMKEKYIEEINEFAAELDENQLLYILTFITKMFGSR